MSLSPIDQSAQIHAVALAKAFEDARIRLLNLADSWSTLSFDNANDSAIALQHAYVRPLRAAPHVDIN